MANRKQESVTLRDIADRLGLSAMTVSRALSGKAHLVSAETARRCKELAEEMGYVPNLMARSLRGEQLHTIVMFAEYISSHHYLAQLVDVVSRSIERRNFSVICCQSISSLRQALQNFRLSGAIILAPPEAFYHQPPLDAASPVCTVIIHSAVEQNRYHEVSPDIVGFCYHAALHLIELGHRELAYVGGPSPEEEPEWFRLRRRGIERAMDERGLPRSNLRHQPCPEAAVGPASVLHLLTHAPQTTGLMCINDEIALASIAGLQAMGRVVPRDVSVIGCNDIKLAGFYRPALTTLAIDINGMVEAALHLLFQEMQDPAPTERSPIKQLVSASLVVRESTGPPPRR